MNARRIAAGTLLALSLGGCVVYIYEPTIRVESEIEGWESTPGLAAEADAAYRARLADLWVSVRADDPFTPVRVCLRPRCRVSARVLRGGAPSGPAGAWRLGDRSDKYYGSRVPREFAFGDVLEVPEGTDLLLEFDPRTVVERDQPASGDVVVFELRIESGNDAESIPVALRVADVNRSWAIGPPTR